MSAIRRIVVVLIVAVLAAAPALACCSQESWAVVRPQTVKATNAETPPASGLTMAGSGSDCAEMTGVVADQSKDGERPCPGCADCKAAFMGDDIVTVKSVENQQVPQISAIAQSFDFGVPAHAFTPNHRLPPPTAPPRQPTPVTLNDVLLI